MADLRTWARRQAGNLTMGLVGLLMLAAAVWLVPDSGTVATALIVMGAILLVVAILNPRFVGKFKLGPLETEIERVNQQVEAVQAAVRDLSHTTDALIVKINAAVEHDEALPVTPRKSATIGMVEEHDQGLPVTTRKSSPERPEQSG